MQLCLKNCAIETDSKSKLPVRNATGQSRAETGTWEVPYESEEKLFTVRVM